MPSEGEESYGSVAARIPGILREWAAGQKRRLTGAFNVGGHQLHGGPMWAPLNPRTGFGLPLHKTGGLQRSMFTRVSGVSVIVGSNSPLAIYHQNGTRSIPKRPVVVVTRSDLDKLKFDLKWKLER